MKENSLIDNTQTMLEYWDQVCQMLNFWYLVQQKKKKKPSLDVSIVKEKLLFATILFYQWHIWS